MCSHPYPSFPWSLDFLTPGFGPWFVVLHPVNYVAENWKLLGMWVSMRWPQDMHSLSCCLCAVSSQAGKLELLGALGAGAQPVALPSCLEISVFIFGSSAPSFLVCFGCPPCSNLDCTCTRFPGFWGEFFRICASCGHP